MLHGNSAGGTGNVRDVKWSPYSLLSGIGTWRRSVRIIEPDGPLSAFKVSALSPSESTTIRGMSSSSCCICTASCQSSSRWEKDEVACPADLALSSACNCFCRATSQVYSEVARWGRVAAISSSSCSCFTSSTSHASLLFVVSFVVYASSLRRPTLSAFLAWAKARDVNQSNSFLTEWPVVWDTLSSFPVSRFKPLDFCDLSWSTLNDVDAWFWRDICHPNSPSHSPWSVSGTSLLRGPLGERRWWLLEDASPEHSSECIFAFWARKRRRAKYSDIAVSEGEHTSTEAFGLHSICWIYDALLTIRSSTSTCSDLLMGFNTNPERCLFLVDSSARWSTGRGQFCRRWRRTTVINSISLDTVNEGPLEMLVCACESNTANMCDPAIAILRHRNVSASLLKTTARTSFDGSGNQYLKKRVERSVLLKQVDIDVR